jgi:hypothetical protein
MILPCSLTRRFSPCFLPDLPYYSDYLPILLFVVFVIFVFEIKLRLHNIISKPALQYGSETWVLGAENKRRIETSEMRFLRSVLGVSLRDKMRSEDVRKQLNTERMVEEIQEYQKKWHNYVERMPPERLPW